MTYTLLAVVQKDDFIYTTVRYDFDGVHVEVSIPHFQPKSVADVLTGIENRAVSESRAQAAAEKISAEIIGQLEIGKAVEIGKVVSVDSVVEDIVP